MYRRYISFFIILLLITTSLISCNRSPLDMDKMTASSREISGDYIDIIDMAGREVSIPPNIDRVFATIPTGTILLYTLSPDKIIGWNYTLRDGEKEYIDKKYHDLANLGGAGKSSINMEELLRENPQLIIEMTGINDNNIKKVEELQAKLNIPIMIIDEDINRLGESYKLLGEILDQEERAKKLAKYIDNVLDSVEGNKEKIPEDSKVNIYYAEGPKGLETEPAGSWHAQLIDMVGGNNVAEVDIAQVKGKSEVSIEQIMHWDPDIIIAWDDERGGYYSGILRDPLWKDIKAVKNDQVYEIVNNPFNWFDRPPSVNRILGLQWIGNLLYPEIYDYDIKEIVREFYYEFYHYDLNDKELDNILKNTIR